MSTDVMMSEIASPATQSYAPVVHATSDDRLAFLKGLWGFVALLAVAFPIGNAAFRVVPMPLDLVAPMATLSTVLSLLTVTYIYVDRRELFAGSRPHVSLFDAQPSKISARALAYTVLALGSFFVYWVLADVLAAGPAVLAGAAPTGWAVYAIKPITILSYSLFFAATACAFNLLTMKLVMDELAKHELYGPVPE